MSMAHGAEYYTTNAVDITNLLLQSSTLTGQLRVIQYLQVEALSSPGPALMIKCFRVCHGFSGTSYSIYVPQVHLVAQHLLLWVGLIFFRTTSLVKIKAFIYANTIYCDREIIDIEVEILYYIALFSHPSSLTTMPHKWTSNEQEEFLTSMLGEFRMHAADKKYEEFWKKQLVTWYHWWKNPAHLGCTSGVKGALKFDTVLAGGVKLKGTCTPQKMNIYSYKYYEEKVKDTADAKIRVEKVTDCRPKLNKRHEVMRRMAICELGPMLDQILKYLAYAMGGWKFMILMGGNDPSTGEVSVFNYHVGELESGVQFDQTYANFDVVQAAFLTFIKDALAFESTLPQDSDNEEAEDSSDSHDSSDEEDLDDLLPNSIHRINTVGMYQMTPQSESSIKDNFAASIASTDASLPHMQTLGNASPGSQLPSDSKFASFNNSSNLPVFDHEVFTALINDPNFNISILDAVPERPPLQSTPYPEVFIPPAPRADDPSSTQYPEVFIPPAPCTDDPSSTQCPKVFIPPAPHTDDASTQCPQVFIPLAPRTDDALSDQYSQVIIPPAPHADVENMGTLNESDGAGADPDAEGTQNTEAPTSLVQTKTQHHRGRHTQQHSQLTAPTSLANEIQPLPEGHCRVRKPFNARECDNDIGGPMKRAQHT
ncbi:uncharacterized protein BJ212DRAFT_1303780 [Suillus subaureus]|uniref:Uncharacterized protein n=1 Tax=Suillus subaureus TaxID=48587 RepID=A0A9P7J759_9AGAM|nr:uncharacterized protein BJ212DRAFT_1303780 [Suillus subaureus]KAG1806128.1 hypothetical protein BJ212DRAFT_1303780 [Suillus subaureus]